MTDIVAAAAFVVFLGLVVSAWLLEARGSTTEARTAASAVIAWGLIVSCAAGLSQRQAWPFVNWVLMPDAITADVAVQGIVAVNAEGVAHPVDHRAWAPLSEEELMAWIRRPFSELSASNRLIALTELLNRAEEARLRVRRGGRASAAPGLLGPLSASTHILHVARWNEPGDAPPTPFVELWVVEDRWNVLERRDGSEELSRVILYRSGATP